MIVLLDASFVMKYIGQRTKNLGILLWFFGAISGYCTSLCGHIPSPPSGHMIGAAVHPPADDLKKDRVYPFLMYNFSLPTTTVRQTRPTLTSGAGSCSCVWRFYQLLYCFVLSSKLAPRVGLACKWKRFPAARFSPHDFFLLPIHVLTVVGRTIQQERIAYRRDWGPGADKDGVLAEGNRCGKNRLAGKSHVYARPGSGTGMMNGRSNNTGEHAIWGQIKYPLVFFFCHDAKTGG